MTHRGSNRDNPWTLAGLVVLAMAATVFGLWAWMQILDGPAR